MRSLSCSLLAVLIPLALAQHQNKHHHRPKNVHRGLDESPLGSMLLATSGNYVTDLSKCPTLKPRATPPTSVHDLYAIIYILARGASANHLNRRPDDFSVAMAIGDSITAGAFAKGINPDNKDLNWVEWRGVSYSGGGDDGAITMPNVRILFQSYVLYSLISPKQILKHYNKTLVGGAQGYNPGYEICFGSGCPVGPVRSLQNTRVWVNS